MTSEQKEFIIRTVEKRVAEMRSELKSFEAIDTGYSLPDSLAVKALRPALSNARAALHELIILLEKN